MARMAATRIGGGAAVGGIVGGIASDSNTGTGWATDVARGALLGGAIGVGGAAIGARGIARKAAKAAGKEGPRGLISLLGSGLWKGGKLAGKGAIGTGKAVWNNLKWINKNPGKFGGLVVGGVAAGALAMSGPADVGRSASQMAQVAEMSGRPSTGFEPGQGADRYSFEQSTQGLVQGLHQGRHRG